MNAATATYWVRDLGTTDRGSPLNAGSVYNLLFGPKPGWLVLKITDAKTLVVIAADGSPLEVVFNAR